MLKPIIAASLIGAVLTVAPVVAAQPAPASPPDARSFVAKAGASNLFEIQSSQLALSRSTTPVVVFFAKKMIEDHTRAGTEMASAKPEQITVPAAVDPLQSDELAELQKLKGPAFDIAYDAMQLMSHDQAVVLFEAYAQSGKPGPLQQFAQKILPMLIMHQTMIHTITGT